MKSMAAADVFIIYRLHALFGQRAGILDGLFADAAKARIDGRIVAVARAAAQHATRPKARPEGRVLGIRGILRLLLGVEVIQIAEEFIESMHCRQELVLVAEMILAELTGGIAKRLERLGNRDVLCTKAKVGSWQANLGKAGAQGRLPGDEARPARRAALLGVVVGEHHALAADAIDVRRPVTHHAKRIGADNGLADVVAHDNEDVGFAP
jgi:hypothetical protein